jgi:hypothetical protein
MIGFDKGWVAQDLLRGRTTLFASFSGKRRTSPPGDFQWNQCFLLFFLEKVVLVWFTGYVAINLVEVIT